MKNIVYLRLVFSWKVRGYIQIAGFYYKTIVYDQITEQNNRVFNRHWYLALQLFPSPLRKAAFSTFILCLICDSLRGVYMANQKVYLMWSNYWDQIILNGIIPISSLVYFNSRFSHFTQFENFGNTFSFDRGVFISTFLNIDAGWIRKVRISTTVRSDVLTWYEADWILDRDLYF